MVTAQSLPQVLLVHTGLDAGVQQQLGQAFALTTLDLRQWPDQAQLAAQLNLLGEQLPQLQMTIIAVPMAAAAAEQQLDSQWFEHCFEQIFAVAQFAAHRLMAHDRGGQLVLLQSVMGEVGHPAAVSTSVLAGATLGLVKSLAKEVARYQVSVNAIALGNCPALGYQLYLDDDYARLFKMTGLGAEVSARHVNAALVFLQQVGAASTGQLLRLDSGMVI
jgi:NAD(P)-dependent dehydrogenase (short-subunit alcohol dehydrogenase family)